MPVLSFHSRTVSDLDRFSPKAEKQRHIHNLINRAMQDIESVFSITCIFAEGQYKQRNYWRTKLKYTK